MITSVLGSLPRPKMIERAYNIGKDIYSDHNIIKIFELCASNIIKSQEQVGINIVNDGEIQRPGYISVFYASFEGYLPTAIGEPFILDDGSSWHHTENRSYKIWQNPRTDINYMPCRALNSSIVVDKISFKKQNVKNTIFHRESEVIKKYARYGTKITLPSPYLLMRSSWHPLFSRDAYNKKEDYLYDIVLHYKELIRDIENIGIDVIQFDDSGITRFLAKELRKRISLDKEIEYYVETLNEIFRSIKKSSTAVHICRSDNHKKIPWGTCGLLNKIFKSLNVSQFGIELNENDPEDILPLKDFRDNAFLLLGIIDSSHRILDHPKKMFDLLKKVNKYVDISRIILSSSCGFSPNISGISALGSYDEFRTDPVPIYKLKNLAMFAQAVSNYGLNNLALKHAENQYLSLNKIHENLLKYE